MRPPQRMRRELRRRFDESWKRVSDKNIPAELRPTDGNSGLLAQSMGKGEVISVDGSQPATASRVSTYQNPKEASEEVTKVECREGLFSVLAGSRVHVINLA